MFSRNENLLSLREHIEYTQKKNLRRDKFTLFPGILILCARGNHDIEKQKLT